MVVSGDSLMRFPRRDINRLYGTSLAENNGVGPGDAFPGVL